MQSRTDWDRRESSIRRHKEIFLPNPAWTACRGDLWERAFLLEDGHFARGPVRARGDHGFVPHGPVLIYRRVPESDMESAELTKKRRPDSNLNPGQPRNRPFMDEGGGWCRARNGAC